MATAGYFDVVVVGGGTTGTAVARDLVMRGFEQVLLVDKTDLAAGTSGRCHSNLHGGGRYIVSDIETARECVRENAILREIAPHTVDPTDGLFIAVDEEGLEYTEKFVENADAIGMYYREVEPEWAMAEEPLISRQVKRAFVTRDAGFDPFRLSASQAVDAARRGATIWVHQEVTGIQLQGGRVVGVKMVDGRTGQETVVGTSYVVNAAGPWAGKVAATAGIDLPMKPDKGTMVIYNFRLARPMVHLLRMPTDGDGLVSMGYQNTTILGTTSGEIVEPDQARPTLEEVERMERMVLPGFPSIKSAKRLRFFCGVRPLCEPGESTGREISRRLILIDHREVHNVEGLLTITGGKYATARLMAETTVDRVCEHLGWDQPCQTHLEPLPGAESAQQVEKDAENLARHFSVPGYAAHKLSARYGQEAFDILERYPDHAYPVCQCGQITASEVVHAVRDEWAQDLDDVRRRTRTGKGSCQGVQCTPQVAELFRKERGLSPRESRREIEAFLEERWRGMHYTAAQGDMATQAALLQYVYGLVADLPRFDGQPAGPTGGSGEEGTRQ